MRSEKCYSQCVIRMVRLDSKSIYVLFIYFLWLPAFTLASQVGYGNVAGFLFHKGILNAPSPGSNLPVMTPSGAEINPITGIAQEKVDLNMTDEEKESEAEKLFVLFDRLEKTGAIPASQNPIRKAAQQGMLG